MRTLVPLSDHPFYTWQALVQNAAGVAATFLVYRHDQANSLQLDALMASGAEVHVWDDWRTDRTYNPAMKPGLVGRWLEAHGHDQPALVIDPDVIPTGRPLPAPQAGRLLGTDTDSYTGPAWLASKGAWEPLCDLVGVNSHQAADWPGVGAQYVTQGIPGSWWLDVADLSVEAYRLLVDLPDDAQPWCAEMYVTHLAAIRDGYAPTTSPHMGMVWANGPASGWTTEAFFHDAGVTEPNGRDFHKGTWQSSPFGHQIDVHPDSASARYVDLIRHTEARFPDLVTAWT